MHITFINYICMHRRVKRWMNMVDLYLNTLVYLFLIALHGKALSKFTSKILKSI